jgi:hypothetical protein
MRGKVLVRCGKGLEETDIVKVDGVSLSELSDMFQNYLSFVSVINGCIGNGKETPRIFAMPA